MAKRLSAQIRSKNQITLPKRLADHADLKEGDFLEFELVTTEHKIEPGVIVVRKKRLAEHTLPAEPLPGIPENQEFPGVKTAIAELRKRMQK